MAIVNTILGASMGGLSVLILTKVIFNEIHLYRLVIIILIIILAPLWESFPCKIVLVATS